MDSELTIIKVGGSLITDKSQPYTLRVHTVASIASEIKYCLDTHLIGPLIIVHGVGSFGHPPVIEYDLHHGFQRSDQTYLLGKTQRIVNQLRLKFVQQLLDSEIPVNLMSASSLIVADNHEIVSSFLDALAGFLSLGMVIVIGGDMFYDRTSGFCVGSGDKIAVHLARELNARRLFFATDVDGVFNCDPKMCKSPHLIPDLVISCNADLLEFGSQTADASGLMHGKLLAIRKLHDHIQTGMDVRIFSMMDYGRLIALLQGLDVPSTKITVRP